MGLSVIKIKVNLIYIFLVLIFSYYVLACCQFIFIFVLSHVYQTNNFVFYLYLYVIDYFCLIMLEITTFDRLFFLLLSKIDYGVTSLAIHKKRLVGRYTYYVLG